MALLRRVFECSSRFRTDTHDLAFMIPRDPTFTPPYSGCSSLGYFVVLRCVRSSYLRAYVRTAPAFFAGAIAAEGGNSQRTEISGTERSKYTYRSTRTEGTSGLTVALAEKREAISYVRDSSDYTRIVRVRLISGVQRPQFYMES